MDLSLSQELKFRAFPSPKPVAFDWINSPVYLLFYLELGGENKNPCLSQEHLHEVKYKQPCPGCEHSSSPFPMTITITLHTCI